MPKSGWALALLLAAIPARAADQGAWEQSMQAGRNAYEKRDLAAAGTAYQKALTEADSEPADEQRALESLRRLAAVHRLSGKAGEAQTLLERAVAIAERTRGRFSTEFADTALDLAQALRAQSQSQAAMPYAQWAVTARKQALGEDNPELPRDLSHLALLAVDMKQFDVARNLYAEALRITEKHAGRDSLRLLPFLDLLGNAHRSENAYAEAEPFYSRALLIRESVYGPDDAELIATLDNLAYVLFGQKRYEEAEPLYLRLMKIWEASAGPEHPMVAVTADKLREFYSIQHKYAEAAPYAERALALRLRAHLESLNRKAGLEIGRGDYASAEQLYRRAVAFAEESQCSEELILPPLQTLATLLKQTRREGEALLLERKAKTLLLRQADRQGRRPAVPLPGAAAKKSRPAVSN